MLWLWSKCLLWVLAYDNTVKTFDYVFTAFVIGCIIGGCVLVYKKM